MPRLNVNPTRIELKKSKARLKAAVSGHKLLKDKADEMVRRFLLCVEEAKILRKNTEFKLAESLKNFALARAVAGSQPIEDALTAGSFNSIAIDLGKKTVMGVDVPTLKVHASDAPTTIPYALASAPPELDDAILKFYDILAPLLKLAEIEKTCSLLASEIQKTRRRVNALEHIMIPDLIDTVAYIQMRLDENERGALVRLMKVKSNIQAKEG